MIGTVRDHSDCIANFIITGPFSCFIHQILDALISLPQFSLPPDQLLAALIRSYLFAELFRAGAEALVTENAARLARMQQAEQSVDEKLEELTAETRSVRQSEITTELLDVIIGFEALKDRDKRKANKDLIGVHAQLSQNKPRSA